MIKKIFNQYTSSKYRFLVPAFATFLVVSAVTGVFVWQNVRAKTAPRPSTKTTVKAKSTSENNTAAATSQPAETKKEDTPTPTPQPTTSQPATTKPVATRPAATPTYTVPVPTVSYSGAEGTIESILIGLINGERARVGVGPLTTVSQLQSAAAIRVSEEAIPSFVGTDHTRPNGSAFNTVYPQVGYTGYTGWGENLVWGYKPQISTDYSQLSALANQMFTSWKNSPDHYANMINGNFNQSGIGVKLINQNGYTYYFAIQDFARR